MYPTSGEGSGFQSDAYQNIPNAALAFTMWTTTFGNGNFIIQPPTPNTLSDDFPTIPYLSLEAVLYESQSSNPATAPVTITAGSNTGQQVISSTQTANDGTGTARSLTGNQTTT